MSSLLESLSIGSSGNFAQNFHPKIWRFMPTQFQRYWFQANMVLIIILIITMSIVLEEFWLIPFPKILSFWWKEGLKVLQYIKISTLRAIWIRKLIKVNLDSNLRFEKNPYKGDLPSNTFRYLELVENVRTDLTFIDTQPMTYDWYLKNQGERFSHLNFPGSKYRLEGDNTFSMADLIKANPSVKGDLVCAGVGTKKWPVPHMSAPKYAFFKFLVQIA